MSLRRERRQKQSAEGDKQNNNPHSLGNEDAHGMVAPQTTCPSFG